MAAATAHPEVGLIGCEPFVNGVAMALGRIAAAGLGNVRLHPGDARDLIELLPEGALARVFLLYPDPWPKARHQRRRFASPENLGALARAMAPGAELRLATDIARLRRARAAAVAAAPGPGRGVGRGRAMAGLARHPLRGEGAGGRPATELSDDRAGGDLSIARRCGECGAAASTRHRAFSRAHAGNLN